MLEYITNGCQTCKREKALEQPLDVQGLCGTGCVRAEGAHCNIRQRDALIGKSPYTQNNTTIFKSLLN